MVGRSNDHEQFLRATMRHADLLHALARRLAPNPADVADIVQETYLRAYAAWGRRHPDDPGAWLATICLNVGRDTLRRHARYRAAVGEAPIPDLARRGRELAETITDPAPPGTRESIRAAVAEAATERESAASAQHSRHLIVLAACVLILTLAGGVATWRPWQNTSGRVTAPQSTVAMAVASFRADRLPGTAVPAQQPPDLSSLGLHVVGASAGQLGGTAVTVFAYRSDAGSRLDLYRSTRAIPERTKPRNFPAPRRPGGPKSMASPSSAAPRTTPNC